MTILVPTSRQEFPNLTPRSPKRAQLVAKIAQNTPQEPLTRPSKTRKYSQNAVLLFVFTLPSVLQRLLPRPHPCAKMLPKSIPNRPKIDSEDHQLSIKSPSWRQHGPTWAHLAPTWRYFNPSCAHPDANLLRNHGQNSPETSQKHPKPLQDPPTP